MEHQGLTIDQNTQGVSVRRIIDQRAQLLAGAPWMLSLRSGECVSYEELQRRSIDWRALVRARGLRPGDRVGILLADPVAYAVCFVALLSAGLWVAPLDPTVLLTNPRQLDERARQLRLVCVASDHEAPLSVSIEWIDASEQAARDGETESSEEATAYLDGGILLATSGTSGTPKVMALPSAQLLCTASLVARHNELVTADRGFNPLPLWHINAEVVGVLATLVSGASLVLDQGFHRTDFWSLLDEYGVTWINAVPAIISRLVVRKPGEEVPSRIRFIRSASAPLSAIVLEEFEESTGIMVVESYGMTEGASQICANPVRGRRKGGSVGPPVGVELRVTARVELVGADALVHEVGNVEIRGPSVITRYEGAGYEDRFDAQGWLRTGDLGYLDDEGYLFLVGRSDDVINRSGEKIFPREIEDVILGVPGVVAAAVLGRADAVFGQVPVAYVQFDRFTSATPLDEVTRAAQEVAQTLVASFSRTRRPVSVSIVEALPVHATGKVQKKLIVVDDIRVLHEEALT